MAASTKKVASEKLTITRMTDAQRKQIGAKVVKLRRAGKSWGDICEATGIPGSITGRKLLRLYGGSDVIAESYSRDDAKANRAKVAKAAKGKVAPKRTTKARAGTRSKARA